MKEVFPPLHLPSKGFQDGPCVLQVKREMTALSHHPLLTLQSDAILKCRPKKCTPQPEILQRFPVALRINTGFPGASDSKASAYNGGDPGFNPWVGKISWRKKWQLTPVFLPAKSHGQRSLMGYSPWGCKESNMTENLYMNIYTCLIHNCQ